MDMKILKPDVGDTVGGKSADFLADARLRFECGEPLDDITIRRVLMANHGAFQELHKLQQIKV